MALALTRRPGESILLDVDIEIKVVSVKGRQVRISIDAPKSINIVRKELLKDRKDET